MSKKRCKSAESRSLRAAVDQQLTAAAEDIFRLLTERRQAELQQLKQLVTERITAALDNIFTVFESSRAADRRAEEPGETSTRVQFKVLVFYFRVMLLYDLLHYTSRYSINTHESVNEKTDLIN